MLEARRVEQQLSDRLCRLLLVLADYALAAPAVPLSCLVARTGRSRAKAGDAGARVSPALMPPQRSLSNRPQNWDRWL